MQNYVSNRGNSRFTKTTSTNLWRSHHLPHVCTKMMHGKFGGVASRKMMCVCACAQVWPKLQRGYRCLGRSHRLPHVCKMYENQCPSLPMTSKFPIADVFAVVHVNQWQRAVFQLPLYNTTACSSALAVKITTSPSCRQLARQSWDILNQTRDSCLPSICTARCETSFGVNLPCFRSIFKHTEQVIELGPERQKF